MKTKNTKLIQQMNEVFGYFAIRGRNAKEFVKNMPKGIKEQSKIDFFETASNKGLGLTRGSE